MNQTEVSSPVWRLTLVTLMTGVLAGLGGMMLALILHAIQHLAFGYSPDAIISNESFLTVSVVKSPPVITLDASSCWRP